MTGTRRCDDASGDVDTSSGTLTVRGGRDGPAFVVAGLIVLVHRYSMDAVVTADFLAEGAGGGVECSIAIDFGREPAFRAVVEAVEAHLAAPCDGTHERISLGVGSAGCIVLTWSGPTFQLEFVGSSRWSALRVARHLDELLTHASHDDGAVAARIECLPDDERREILRHWNLTSEDVPETTIDALVARRAARTPDALAVEDLRGGRLTYRALLERADAIATVLRLAGARRGSFVGLCVERTTDCVAAVLAVLRCGSAYVPLDPSYPSDRLRYIVEDSGVGLVLASDATCHALPTARDRTVIVDDITTAVDHDGEPTGEARSSSDAAYVLYTSGSTGRPKGVVIQHSNAVNLITWATRTFAFEEVRRTLLGTSLNFDLSVFEMFVPLVVGATVVVADSVLDLADGSSDDLTLVNTVPSAASELARLDAFPAAITTVCLAGEPLTADLVERIEACGVPRVVNLYGPTETTTYSTWTDVAADGRKPLIGRPLANTRVYLLDPDGRLVAVGVPGELHIAGFGVACGYHNRPELTGDRFVPDPFAAPGERMYRTGDIARYLDDGSLEYLGRVDHQVKLRGFRVELGEVESVLRRSSSIADVAVIVDKADTAGARLIAFGVPPAGATIDVDGVVQDARRLLPAYMVPARVIQLAELPLTPNGKVDRLALATLVTNAPKETSPRVWRDPIDARLAELWCEILAVGSVDDDDDFFSCGGTSLSAAQLLADVESFLGIQLPLSVLAQSARFGDLAALVRSDARVASSPVTAYNEHGSRPPLFLAQMWPGGAETARGIASRLGEDQPVFVIRPPGLDGTNAPASSIEAVGAHLARMVREICPSGPYRLAGHSLGGTAAYETARQLVAGGASVDLVAVFDTTAAARFSLRNRSVWVLRHLAGLGMRDRVGYIATRSKKRLQRRRASKVERPASRPQTELERIVACHRAALGAYVAQPVPIRLVLFLAADSRSHFGRELGDDLGWTRLVRQVDIEPVAGSHLTMMRPDILSEWVPLLHAHLDAVDVPVAAA